MKTNKRFAVLPLLLLWSFACVSFAKPGEIVYLIPADFTGGVIIFYNQPDGVSPDVTEDGTIIYRVPQDGLIKVKEPLKRAAYKFSYYFVDEKGNKTPIEYLYPKHYVRNSGDTTSKSFDTISEDETNNKTFAMIHTTTNFNSRGEKVYSQNFMIGKPKDYGMLYQTASHIIFSIQKEMMRKEKAEKQQQQR